MIPGTLLESIVLTLGPSGREGPPRVPVSPVQDLRVPLPRLDTGMVWVARTDRSCPCHRDTSWVGPEGLRVVSEVLLSLLSRLALSSFTSPSCPVFSLLSGLSALDLSPRFHTPRSSVYLPSTRVRPSHPYFVWVCVLQSPFAVRRRDRSGRRWDG